ncbi:hypothetical protein FIBSPDRAFT_842083 [Athelia psychrophila]|uniref:Uncharacterized protein n=1 Tax=Athelia psychrophila TaxID=1759441 RepID=A0A167WUD3_9AGAM|nr:hypothetical protein FIBSPDRAFT_842083 [Fibularhizoctonia sp. CBS 109695]
MSTTSTAPSVLMVGLPWDHPLVAAQAHDPTVIRDGLDRVIQATNNAGYNLAPYYFGPGDAAGLQGLVALLKKNDYDAVVVGFGVRGSVDLTEFFEEIVNTVKDTAPRARLLFNSSPPSTLDAVKRAFPLA